MKKKEKESKFWLEVTQKAVDYIGNKKKTWIIQESVKN